MYSRAARLVRVEPGAGMKAADETELAGGEERVCGSEGEKNRRKREPGWDDQRIHRAGSAALVSER